MAKKKTPSDGDDSAGAEARDASRPYVVLARKYRPASFDDLIGQDAMVTTLRNAFSAGRIAQGFMLTGVRGVGKTTTARILARALNYQTDTIDKPTIDMPGLGLHCAEIMEGRHPDVFEMDAASNTGVDNVREIIESAQYTPIIARAKVFIIDEVHMLSKGAFNALLKTLEEPPPHVKFIFATTEIRKVPVTVLSRCQRFDLRRVEQPVLVKHFKMIAGKEGARADDDALALIARSAEGSVRDGLSLLDRAIAMAGGGAGSEAHGHVTAAMVRNMIGLADRGRIFDLAECLFRGDAAAALKSFSSLHHDGAEPVQIVADLAEAVHTIARIKVVGEEPAGEGLAVEEKARGTHLGSRLSMPYLSRAWQMLLKGLEETGRAPNPVAAAEMVLIRLACTSDLPTPDELIRTLGGGAVSRGAPLATRDAPEVRDARGPLNAAQNLPAHANYNPSDAANDEEDFYGEADTRPLAPSDASEDEGDLFDTGDAGGEAGNGELVDGEMGPTIPAYPDPRSFADVIALAGTKRDARLKIALEDHVSLVKFDAKAGSIDIFLLPGASPDMANDLREKLNMWTGRRWVVVLSKIEGEPAVGVVRREKDAKELEALKAHPAVRALLEVFPDAKIAEIRKIVATVVKPDDESAAG